MHLVLVRHTSVDVPPGVCYGHTDVPVASGFAREAAEVAAQLDGREFDAVYTSPSSRCVMLAEACGYPRAIRDPRLMEMDFGDWEMQRWDDITDPRLQMWYDDWRHVAATGGESFADHAARVASFMESLMATGARSALVFAHGGTVMHAALWRHPSPPDDIFGLRPQYGGIIEIERN